MRRSGLSLPGLTLAIEGDEPIVNGLRRFYPYSVTEGRPPRPTHSAVAEQLKGRWHLSLDGVDGRIFDSPEQLLLALEYEIENTVIGAVREQVALHAGAVAVNGQAIILAGNSGTGKSSTTFQLLELGHGFLCEEIALVDPESLDVLPYPQSISLNTAYTSDFESQRAIAGGRLEPSYGDLTRYIPLQACEQPLPAGTLLLPLYDPKLPAEAKEVPAGEVLAELLGYCFPPNGSEEELFDAIIGIAERLRILRLTYPDMLRARQLLAELFPPPPKAQSRSR